MSDRKFIGLCIVAAAIIVALALVVSRRYSFQSSPPTAMRFDHVTGQAWVLRPAPEGGGFLWFATQEQSK